MKRTGGPEWKARDVQGERHGSVQRAHRHGRRGRRAALAGARGERPRSIGAGSAAGPPSPAPAAPRVHSLERAERQRAGPSPGERGPTLFGSELQRKTPFRRRLSLSRSIRARRRGRWRIFDLRSILEIALSAQRQTNQTRRFAARQRRTSSAFHSGPRVRFHCGPQAHFHSGLCTFNAAIRACGSLWKTRSVFQGAVDAVCASTAPAASTAQARGDDPMVAPVESAVPDQCLEHLLETCASTGPP